MQPTDEARQSFTTRPPVGGGVRATPLKDGQPVERGRRPRIGFIRPGQVERAFIGLLYVMLLLLVALSVLGTFYGQRGQNAPIDAPLISALSQIARDIISSPVAFGIALLIQFVLTAVQYGARQFAKQDRRWWLLYLASLGVSVYYNIQAYWTPLTALLPLYFAGLLIVAGDILPEFLAVRRE